MIKTSFIRPKMMEHEENVLDIKLYFRNGISVENEQMNVHLYHFLSIADRVVRYLLKIYCNLSSSTVLDH